MLRVGVSGVPPCLSPSVAPRSLLSRDSDLGFGVLEHPIDVWVHLVELDHVGHVVLLVDAGVIFHVSHTCVTYDCSD